MVQPPTISVVIVSYNTREMTLECLRAVFADLDGLSADVWVVDNASADGSVDAIRNAFPSVHVIANGRNVGFGAANNQAMREAKGQYFLLLNTDAFLRPGAIRSLLAHMAQHVEIGVLAPRLLNKDESLQRSCYPFPNPARVWIESLFVASLFRRHTVLGGYRAWGHDEDCEVDWAIGACLLIRREVYDKVGGFDEAFFMYGEETDWQLRIRQAGWKIAFTPSASVMHLGGASGAGDRWPISDYPYESMERYELKHHGWGGLALCRIARAIGCSARVGLWLPRAVVPAKRKLALRKLRLNSWLVARQFTHWRLGQLRGASDRS